MRSVAKGHDVAISSLVVGSRLEIVVFIVVGKSKSLEPPTFNALARNRMSISARTRDPRDASCLLPLPLSAATLNGRFLASIVHHFAKLRPNGRLNAASNHGNTIGTKRTRLPREKRIQAKIRGEASSARKSFFCGNIDFDHLFLVTAKRNTTGDPGRIIVTGAGRSR